MGQNIHDYSDIIDLPHHVSSTRPQMDLYNRAAQFSPFAALTGYEDAILETGRITDSMALLSEDAYGKLDEMYAYLKENLWKKPQVTFTYFEPDLFKEGGAYKTKTGVVKTIHEQKKVIYFLDGTSLSIHQIVNIEIV